MKNNLNFFNSFKANTECGVGKQLYDTGFVGNKSKPFLKNNFEIYDKNLQVNKYLLVLGGCPGREDSMLEEALNTSLENPKGEVSKLVEGKTPSLLYDDSYTDRKWSVEENLNIVEAHIKKGGIFFFAKEKIQMQSVG